MVDSILDHSHTHTIPQSLSSALSLSLSLYFFLSLALSLYRSLLSVIRTRDFSFSHSLTHILTHIHTHLGVGSRGRGMGGEAVLGIITGFPHRVPVGTLPCACAPHISHRRAPTVREREREREKRKREGGGIERACPVERHCKRDFVCV